MRDHHSFKVPHHSIRAAKRRLGACTHTEWLEQRQNTVGNVHEDDRGTLKIRDKTETHLSLSVSLSLLTFSLPFPYHLISEVQKGTTFYENDFGG